MEINLLIFLIVCTKTQGDWVNKYLSIKIRRLRGDNDRHLLINEFRKVNAEATGFDFNPFCQQLGLVSLSQSHRGLWLAGFCLFGVCLPTSSLPPSIHLHMGAPIQGDQSTRPSLCIEEVAVCLKLSEICFLLFKSQDLRRLYNMAFEREESRSKGYVLLIIFIQRGRDHLPAVNWR